MNVYKSRRESQQSVLQPLLYLIPYPLTVIVQCAWLSAPTPSESTIVYSPMFLVFVFGWGLQFAHQVGRMILAHVTSQPFPWWDSMWIWSIVGALDANLPRIAGMCVNHTSRPSQY